MVEYIPILPPAQVLGHHTVIILDHRTSERAELTQPWGCE